MENRYWDIDQAHPNTGTWLFQCDLYRRWSCREHISSHNGFLWIKAKPGAGKSTLMKQILLNIQSQTVSQCAVAAYFFNARGTSSLEKSQSGMLRTLLHQLVHQVPSLCREIEAIFASKKETYGDKWSWHATELRQAMSSAILNSKDFLFYLLIDALDECDEDVRDVVSFFEKLCCSATDKDVSLNLLFVSRHYPNISVGKSLELNLDEREERIRDISSYVKTELKIERAEGLVEEITQRSARIFLWTVLVVKKLNKAYDDGQGHKLHEILRGIPAGLNGLFADLFNTAVDPESVLILQWVAFSERALTPVELYLAVLSDTEEFQAGNQTLQMDVRNIERFILYYSRGLIKIVNSKRSHEDFRGFRKLKIVNAETSHRVFSNTLGDSSALFRQYECYVEFIHESVKDFLLGSEGLRRLKTFPTDSNVIGHSHEELKNCCINYLNDCLSVTAQESRYFKIADHRPFFPYAASQALRHAYLAECTGISQENLDSHFGFHKDHLLSLVGGSVAEAIWDHVDTDFVPLALIIYPNMPHLHIATFYGIMSWMHALIEAGSDVNELYEPFGSALILAAAQQNTLAVNLLLEVKANPDHLMDFDTFKCSALYFAVEAGNIAMISKLLSSGADSNAALGNHTSVLIIGLDEHHLEEAQKELKELQQARRAKNKTLPAYSITGTNARRVWRSAFHTEKDTDKVELKVADLKRLLGFDPLFTLLEDTDNIVLTEEGFSSLVGRTVSVVHMPSFQSFHD